MFKKIVEEVKYIIHSNKGTDPEDTAISIYDDPNKAVADTMKMVKGSTYIEHQITTSTQFSAMENIGGKGITEKKANKKLQNSKYKGRTIKGSGYDPDIAAEYGYEDKTSSDSGGGLSQSELDAINYGDW